jgi:hypothetical protein
MSNVLLFFMSFTVFQSRSLAAPYGNCVEDQKLRYFVPNQTYSVAKCELECQTDQLRRQCFCKQAHMLGMNNGVMSLMFLSSVSLIVGQKSRVYRSYVTDPVTGTNLTKSPLNSLFF